MKKGKKKQGANNLIFFKKRKKGKKKQGAKKVKKGKKEKKTRG